MQKLKSLCSVLGLVLFQFQLQANSRVAAARATHTSLQFTAASYDSPEYGSSVMQWTTYDGSSAFPLVQSTGSGYLVSGEFIPSTNNTYLADYLVSDSNGFAEYGDITLSVPFVDNNSDGIPDLLQINQSVAISISGLMHEQAPFGLTRGWSGTLTRAAGSAVGSYSLTRFDDRNAILNGQWQVGVSAGIVTYDRSNDSLHFDLVSQGTTASVTNSGTTIFTVLSDSQISLGGFVLVSSSTGAKLTNQPTILQRIGNTYMGYVTLNDGSLATSWPDFTQVQMTLVDTNDFDGNGVPDLTDVWRDPPIIQSQPADIHSTIGANVIFSASVTGFAPLQYQWLFNGVPLTGQTNSLLQINNVQKSNVGAYTLVITNYFDLTLSRAALLFVNKLPTIVLSSPPDQSTFGETDSVTVSANAADSDGHITQVDIYDGTVLIASLTAPPFSIQHSFTIGVHSLIAKATDDSGATIASAPILFTIQQKNELPTVAILAPISNAVYLTNQTITALAVANDPDGTLAQAQFSLNGQVGSSPVGNFTTNYSNLAPGKYVLNAVATDNRGGTTTSASVSFSVVVAPHIISLTPLGRTNVYILASGTAEIFHVLQYSVDAVHWSSVATNTVVRGQIPFTDEQRTNTSRQFYRVIIP